MPVRDFPYFVPFWFTMEFENTNVGIWLEENIGEQYKIWEYYTIDGEGIVYFKNKVDVMAFKLRWL